MEEPASLKISKAVARIARRPRHKRPLPSLKVKWNTNASSEVFEMSEPIYKFFMGKFLEPWYQLSKEEQDSLQAKLRDAKKKSGCTQPIVCNSSWSSDQWSFAGYEVFPDIEAVQKYMAALHELSWFR